MKVGILGGGQLAQLLAHAAHQLNIETLCLCQSAEEPASRNSEIMLDEGTEACLKKFAQQVDVITLENENVDVNRLEFLQALKPVYPGPNTIKVSQDRLFEKQTFVEHDIPTVAFANITTEAELIDAWQKFGRNAILKTRRFGYDGKGQIRIRTEAELTKAWQDSKEKPLILEGFMPFDFEVSLIGARNTKGEQVFFPLIHNTHEAGILRTSVAPFENQTLQAQAQTYMQKLFEHFDYVGVLAFEFFVKDGQLYANELAPRVHNSGHLTLDAANTSQFHLHLLSILGLPLVQPHFNQIAAMINLIGSMPAKQEVLRLCPDAFFYDYGKQARPDRKLGHINVLAENEIDLQKKLSLIKSLINAK